MQPFAASCKHSCKFIYVGLLCMCEVCEPKTCNSEGSHVCRVSFYLCDTDCVVSYLTTQGKLKHINIDTT